MADSFVSKLITELTAKTTAADTDLVPIADSNGNFFKMTWQKMKQLLLGTKDISGVGDGTVTGAISELNTKIDVAFYVSSSAVTTLNQSSCKHKRVLLDIEVNVSAGGDIVLGAIQDGYRPKRRIYIQVAQFDGAFNRTYATAVIDTDGVIQLKSSTQNPVFAWINCSYDID